ncbi:MAG: lipopolysaccharide kinase InaA family protein, partial [Syntrophobacteraceae bacterium]
MCAKSPGISIRGPLCEECLPAVRSLLSAELPKGWEWVGSSEYAVVAKSNTPQGFYYKEFLPRSPFEGLKTVFRGSRCERAMRSAQLLVSKGFHSPKVLCWGTYGQRCFMITEAVDAIGINQFITANLHLPVSRDTLVFKRNFIVKLGMEIGRMHAAGIVHGDLRPNNVLVESNGGETIFHFIDNERNLCFRKIPLHLVVKNLVQISFANPIRITLQDRRRFFKAYCTAYDRFTESEERTLGQMVHKKFL